MTEHARIRPTETPRHFRWWPRQRPRFRPPTRLEILLGILALGIGLAAGLSYAWLLAPVPAVDTEPHQLHRLARAEYMVSILLRWATDEDWAAAIRSLEELEIGEDIPAAVAELACELVGRGYTQKGSGFRAIQQVVRFYQRAGASGCADVLGLPSGSAALVQITAPAPTALPTATSGATALPAPPSTTRAFQLSRLETHCEAATAGLIIVYVQEPDSRGIRGQRVRVSWEEGESFFVTGLHPGQDPGYGDFAMQRGRSYRVELPGQSAPSAALLARSCQARGRILLRSYHLTFRPAK